MCYIIRMEQSPKLEKITLPKAYTNSEGTFTPEGVHTGLKRHELDSMIHSALTVSDTREWDEDMHPQVSKLQVGETVVLTSGAYEYMKVTRNANETFDAERGVFDPA